jgi:NADH-quinone oxidoreductase subunit J
MFEVLFLGFSTNLLLSCILTITAYNAVSALIALIFAFINATCIFFLMELEFIGLLYLIVYVGAVSVLFLFSVMLFNLKNVVRTKTTSFLFKNLLRALLIVFFFYFTWNPLNSHSQSEAIAVRSFFSFSNSDVFFIGQSLYGQFFIYLILAAIILLISMLGAVILIHNPKDQTQMQHALKQITRSIQITLQNSAKN